MCRRKPDPSTSTQDLPAGAPRHLDPVQRPDRVADLGAGGLEGSEVVAPFEAVRRLAHRRDIERSAQPMAAPMRARGEGQEPFQIR